MGFRDSFQPFGSSDSSDGQPFLSGDGEQMIIDRLIGNAFEVVKYVACHLTDIIRVSNFLKSFDAPVPAPQFNSLVNEITWGANVVIDASKSFVQELVLTGNVTSSSLINGSAGYPFFLLRFVQDATGGRTFVWPAGILTHGEISLDPNSVSQQMFAKNGDGTYSYVSPMMNPGA